VFGRNRAPASVRARLERDERVLAWGIVGDRRAETVPEAGAEPGEAADNARHIVATNLGLWWPDEPPRRIPWHLIVRATWSERGLTIIEADIVADLLLVERSPQVAPLRTEGKIPPQVRKRVEGSISTTHEVRLDDGPAMVIARRVTGQDGQLWLARLGPRTPDTERARAQLRALVDRFQADDEARREALLR
jgi:hypothetical protein